METVFIDTSVFIQHNYLEGPLIKQLLDWGRKEYIRILLPEIVFRELVKNGNLDIDAVYEKKKDIEVLLNIPSIKPGLKFLASKPSKEFSKYLKETLDKAKCTWLGYPKDIAAIFSNYFDNKPPFHLTDKKKKSEFPDAFILQILEEWCEENKEKCYVFTRDKGMADHKGKNLEQHDISKFVDEKLRDLEKKYLETAEALMKEKEAEFVSEIERWAYSYLDDISFFNDYVNTYEIHDVDIKELHVDLLGYSFTNVTKPYISFHSNARIRYRVEIEVDDENNGYYDSEDKQWYALDTTTEVVDEQLIVPIEFKLDVPEAGLDYMEPEMEINNGNGLPEPKPKHEI